MKRQDRPGYVYVRKNENRLKILDDVLAGSHVSCKVSYLTPTLQKLEGFRVKAPKGEVVVFYFEPLATQNLKPSGFPEGETTWQNRHHPSGPVVARRAKSDEFTSGDIQRKALSL